jgi:hypothetical protein
VNEGAPLICEFSGLQKTTPRRQADGGLFLLKMSADDLKTGLQDVLIPDAIALRLPYCAPPTERPPFLGRPRGGGLNNQ